MQTMAAQCDVRATGADPAKRPKRILRWIVAVFCLVVLTPVLFSWLSPAPPPFELLTTDAYQRRTKRFAFIRDARAWLTRISPKIFGFAPVHISGTVTKLDGEGPSAALRGLPDPHYSSNTVRVWILSSNEVFAVEVALRREASTQSGWRINTSDGTPCTLSTAPASPGATAIDFDNHPKVRGRKVDLASIVRTTSKIMQGRVARTQTNQEAAFRILLDVGEGAIIVDGSSALAIWAYAPVAAR